MTQTFNFRSGNNSFSLTANTKTEDFKKFKFWAENYAKISIDEKLSGKEVLIIDPIHLRGCRLKALKLGLEVTALTYIS